MHVFVPVFLLPFCVGAPINLCQVSNAKFKHSKVSYVLIHKFRTWTIYIQLKCSKGPPSLYPLSWVCKLQQLACACIKHQWSYIMSTDSRHKHKNRAARTEKKIIITRASARKDTNTPGQCHFLMYKNNLSLWQWYKAKSMDHEI